MKLSSPILSLQRSVFLKMLCVLSLAGVLINGVVFWAAKTVFRPRPMGGPQKTFEGYSRLLAAEIAKHDNFERARALAKQFDIDFRIQGEDWEWASDPSLPPLERLGNVGAFSLSAFRGFGPRGDFRPHFIVEQEFPRGPARVAVFFPKVIFASEDVNVRGILLLIALFTLILWSSYRLIKWILAPLRTLTAAVTRISEGNFDCQVGYSGRDELGQLATAFNRMSLKLKEMMEMRRQLLIDVSHELRSPLARAVVALDAVSDARTKHEIAEEMDEMDRLVHQILEGARMESGAYVPSRAPSDVSALLREIAARYCGAGREVLVSEPAPEMVASLDANRFRTVIKNLVENAIKYSASSAPVRIELMQRDGGFEVVVSDEGIGIPKDELAKVFEPFYRVDKSRTRATGGFGLGLSLCKKIVEAHGGTITIESEVDRGTRVHVFLPAT